MKSMVSRWHTYLDMPKYDLAWHQQDMVDELAEYEESSGVLHRWSELSDVVYTYTRSLWSGHTEVAFPFGCVRFYVGALYMVPKYTLRWWFFREVGRRVGAELEIHEVRNPDKAHKMDAIAEKYHVDPVRFAEVAQHLRKRRVFLK